MDRLKELASDVRSNAIVDTGVDVFTAAKRHNLPFLAAGLAYYGMLALIPGLIALVSIYGLFADTSDVASLVDNVGNAAPAEVAMFLEGQLNDIVDSPSGGLGLSAAISILGALWASSAGTKSLIRGVNIAYSVSEARSGLKLRIISLGITLGIVAFVGGALLLSGFGELLGGVVERLRWPLLGIGTIAGLAILYKTAPSGKSPAWRNSWIGAALAAAAWLGASFALSIYMSRFGSFNETYGTLGAAIATMFWLFVSGYVVLLGAVVNATLED